MPLDFRAAFAAPQTCADCGAAELRPDCDGDWSSFVCAACSARWHVDHGVTMRSSDMTDRVAPGTQDALSSQTRPG